MNRKSKGSILMLSSFTSGKLLFPLKSSQEKEKEFRQLCYNQFLWQWLYFWFFMQSHHLLLDVVTPLLCQNLRKMHHTSYHGVGRLIPTRCKWLKSWWSTAKLLQLRISSTQAHSKLVGYLCFSWNIAKGLIAVPNCVYISETF